MGAKGIVYGEDIQQPMLDMLTKNMSTRHIANVPEHQFADRIGGVLIDALMAL